MIKSKQQGFTLVELLVAIAIFAVLSALGWKIFDYLNKVKDRNAVHEQQLLSLQDSYLQMQRDALQIVPLTANIAGQIQPALLLDDQSLQFSKAGVTDPLKQGLSPFERIEYRYNAQDRKVYRLKYPNLNVLQTTQPLSSTILENVDEFQITILNPNELNSWPDTSTISSNSNEVQDSVARLLPKGMRIRFKQQDVEYEWIFSLLNTDYLKPASSQ
ncbi:type II secretion system minor pseudopilin GspJ [Acinetobacter sp. YH12239]|uniref:type II secretion system minor pseudopilin GspJ n=1 Tax=Acinetobacter sp. YH12239 TaxID=2601166 RepID=UPI0015D3FA2E|nr:type II secretion system minor pseudopilin GspJ [Acinetobacter sp. YH12239]